MSTFEFKTGNARPFSPVKSKAPHHFSISHHSNVLSCLDDQRGGGNQQKSVTEELSNSANFDISHIPVQSRHNNSLQTNPMYSAGITSGTGSMIISNYSTAQTSPVILTKLEIGQQNDKYELEAERTADNIMGMDDPVNQQQFKLRNENKIQLKAISAEASGSRTATQLMTAGLTNNTGQPLSHATRAFIEPRFGHNFRHVRIHTDPGSTKMNHTLNARAFTFGSNIYFNRGEYSPQTSAGKRLLAHELTHVIQQAGNYSTTPDIQRSAIASWEDASFDQRAATKKEALGLNTNPEDITREDPIRTAARRSIHKRQQRQFERKVNRADPVEFAEKQQEIETKFKNKPNKKHRKLNRLKKRFDKANEKLDLPELPKILVITAEYHYVPINSVNKQIVDFPETAIEDAKNKFRVGGVWQDIDYKGTNIAVRFDIKFTKHRDENELKQFDNHKVPGHIPMRTKNIPNEGAGEFSFDFTGDRKQQEAKVTGQGGKFAEANADLVNIDTQAIRNRKTNATFFKQDTDRDSGQPVTKSEKISGRDYSLLMASFIAHEIGHNIGMIHDDLGIMISSFNVPKPSLGRTELTDKNGQLIDTIYELDVSFQNVKITEKNVSLLVSRIDQMTKEQGIFWKNEIERRKTDSDPNNDIQETDGLKDSGITEFTAPSAGD